MGYAEWNLAGIFALPERHLTGTDSQLYSRSTDISNDTRVDVIVPNGQYTLTLYGEPGFDGFTSNQTCGNTAGQNVYDWAVQGQTAASWLDGYVLAGMQPYNGYTLTAQTTVTDNLLSTVGRMRVYGSTYGMSWSSLLITPGGSLPLTISTSTLPNGTVGTAYSANLAASYGVPPYTWSLANGSGPLPPGLTLAANGVISGTPTTTATYPFTVQVTDSNMNTATRALSIVVSPQGSFRLVGTPVLLSIAQGNQGKGTVTSIISNGFNSTVALSASGLPSGATATFNPSTLAAPGSGSSSMLVTVASNTPTGAYPITITGNGGGLQQTTSVTLNVTASAGTFTISASPTSLTIAQGTQGTSTITTAISGNFNSSIALSASGLPSGAAATFNPISIPAPGNGSSTMTITVSSNTPTGTYPITVKGSGGGVQQSATVTMTVVALPSFTISASPTTLIVVQGNQGTSTITTTATNGFGASIALSASGLPSGASASFNPAAIPSPGNGTSALTISVGSGTPTGSYPISVTGNGGGVQQTTTITLTVTGVANFTLSLSPPSQNVKRGSRSTFTATLTAMNGFNNGVSLSLSGCPSHATCSFSPSPLTPPGTSTLTVSTGRRTQDGNYTLTITGASGSLRHSTTVSLSVND